MKPWLVKPRATECRLCGSNDLYPQRAICRTCRLKQLKDYRIEFGTDNEYHAAYRDANRDKIRAYNREYKRGRKSEATTNTERSPAFALQRKDHAPGLQADRCKGAEKKAQD